MQCQVMNAAIMAAEISPEVTATESDLSNVKTRWRTVAVAMSMESSSPIEQLEIFYMPADRDVSMRAPMNKT